MNPGRFFMPRMGTRVGPMSDARYLPTRGSVGLFGRIANSIKTFNWSGLLSGANKTLNVVNQTIPLVRQAGPMLNNMKSMLRIAKVFGSETTRNNPNNRGNRTLVNSNINTEVTDTYNSNENREKEISNNSYPNFFV